MNERYTPNTFSPENLHGPNGALWRGDREHGGLTVEAMEAETLILARRANDPPDTEAKLAEAVELLERWSAWLHRAPGELEIPVSCALEVIEIRDDARAFLDKVKA